MHIRSAALVAFCDAETGAYRSRRIAGHLAKCEKCSDQLRRIQQEKEELAAGVVAPAGDHRPGWDGVQSAISAWRDGRNWAAPQLKSRLRGQIETYFGSPALQVMDRPEMRSEQLLGRTSEILNVFLGPSAAEAVADDCLRGLRFLGPAGEKCR